jgi:hypothetical protein
MISARAARDGLCGISPTKASEAREKQWKTYGFKASSNPSVSVALMAAMVIMKMLYVYES